LGRFVELDRLYRAGRFAPAAAYAFFLVEQHASAWSQIQGVYRANFFAFWHKAAPAHDRDIIAGQAAV